MYDGSICHLIESAIGEHAKRGLIAIVGEETVVTYAEFNTMLASYRSGFRSWTVDRGTIVAFSCSKRPQSVAAFFGAMAAGLCPVMVDTKLSHEAVSDQISTIGIRHLVTDNSTNVAGDTRRLLQVHKLDSLKRSGSANSLAVKLSGEDRAMALFTSGSTGHPKAIMLTHANLLCNALGIIDRTKISPEDRLLHVMPLHHTNGINNQLVAPLLAGATIILRSRFDPAEAVLSLLNQSATYMTGVPTMYSRMLDHVRQNQKFPHLRFLRCGSAPIGTELHHRVEKAFGVPLVTSYGLSEATCTSTMNPPDRRKIGTVGTVLNGQTIQIVDPSTGEEVPVGCEGEVCIGGPAVMKGYFSSATAFESVSDDRLRTGDLGRFDSEGYLTISGRLKDVIIRGGANISPAAVESCLLLHVSVKECCVVAASDSDLGEVPVAFIVQGETSPRYDELSAHTLARLSKEYLPARIYAVDRLPTTSVGKIDRRFLKKVADGVELGIGARLISKAWSSR